VTVQQCAFTPLPARYHIAATEAARQATTTPKRRYVQRLHAIDVATGAQKQAPREIRASIRGKGPGSANGIVEFNPLRDHRRAALLLTLRL
jgi:hypothetical protein